MPGHARKDIVRKGEIGVYHTWSRCVQQAYLCGYDATTKIDYNHRREWITKLLEYQASVFAVDIGNYSILSNHQHLIVRLRPDIAKTWSDEEVAWRWKLAWPTWANGQWTRYPTDEQIEKLLADPDAILRARANLADLSWFMARWKEPIAKMANAESGTKGHFYEQRFGSREVVDEAGLLCTNVYVDLNQVKAGIAGSLEDCRYSAIHDRIIAWRQREAVASHTEFREESPEDYELEVPDVSQLIADCFLSPIGLGGPLTLVDSVGQAMIQTTTDPTDELSAETSSAPSSLFDDGFIDEADSDQGQREPLSSDAIAAEADGIQTGVTLTTPSKHAGDSVAKKPTWKIHRRLRTRRRRRSSDQAILDMPFKQYLDVVRLSAAQIGGEETRPPPDNLSDVLRRYGINPSRWFPALDLFESWFSQAVGSVEHLSAILEKRGQQWIKGLNACRNVFG